MALLLPFATDFYLPKHYSHSSLPFPAPKPTNKPLSLHPPQIPFPSCQKILKKHGTKCAAIAEKVGGEVGGDGESVILGLTSQELRDERLVVEYNWTEEWYPLYLTKDVPDDAPLGLTVFDKQVVLYRDGSGVLRCFEDRCPHR